MDSFSSIFRGRRYSFIPILCFYAEKLDEHFVIDEPDLGIFVIADTPKQLKKGIEYTIGYAWERYVEEYNERTFTKIEKRIARNLKNCIVVEKI